MPDCKAFVIGVGEVLYDLLPEGKRCGGAPANVVYHLTQLGVPSAVVSAVGRDALGGELLEFLQSKGLATEYVGRNGLPTGVVRVTVQDGIPSYDICRPAAWDAIGLPPDLKSRLPEVSAVIWGTLAQRDAASRDTIGQILRSVPEGCLKCFDVNLRQDYYSQEVIETSLKQASVLKINEEELSVLAGMFRIGGTPEEEIWQFFRRYGLKYVICTLGARGSMLFDGTSFSRYPVTPCCVVDTVGCGDAFLAAWICTVLRGGTAQEGMAAGTELSAAVASRAGAME